MNSLPNDSDAPSPELPAQGNFLSRRNVVVCASLATVLLSSLVVSHQLSSVSKDAVPYVSGQQPPVSVAHFCPATSGSEGGSIILNNESDQPQSGLVDLVGSEGAVAKAPVNVPAKGEVTVSPRDLMADRVVAATATFSSDQLEVAHRFTSAQTEAVPCAPEAATTWHFTDGTTEENAGLELALYNPFPDAAVANVSFATNAGPAGPTDLEGVVVPARSLVTLNVGNVLKRRDWIAPTIDIRRGRIIANMLQSSSVGGNSSPLKTVAGTSRLSAVWLLGTSAINNTTADSVSVFNPANQEVGASVLISAVGSETIEPFRIRIPPRGRVLLNLHAEARLPRDVPLTVEVRTSDGTAVLAARSVGAPINAPKGASDFRLGQPG